MVVEMPHPPENIFHPFQLEIGELVHENREKDRQIKELNDKLELAKKPDTMSGVLILLVVFVPYIYLLTALLHNKG